MTKSKTKEILFTLLSVAILIAVWWILAETKFKQTGVLPTPIDTIKIIIAQIQKDSFFKAILSTLQRSLISFTISFTIAGILAVLAHLKGFIAYMINPFITLCRSVPTMALVLILLLTVNSYMLPIVVAFLVVFPLCYENMKTAIDETDKRLITMAKVFKIPKHRQIIGIYIPAMLPYVFASIISGFGLNIKVIISAEVMGLPTMSIGHLILSARQSFDFKTSFAWLIIAVILSLICELILKKISKLSMPWLK
ncbi:MAG: ABC transporter permease subunit [Oscillospiraceae bacterium]|jgi:NitT/TauT family transport system permease protein|nr:ABC transporter permease subunit [Oscillospiraceae bacterium]